MEQESLITLLADIIAAGRIERLPARTPWPLHAALAQLYEESGRLGMRGLLGLDFHFIPSPEAGLAVAGADSAMRSLVRAGLLREKGSGLDAHLQIDPAAVVDGRRRLMLLEPRAVALLQRAGERWAALASTCWKYADKPCEVRSSAPSVASATA
jgi:hypothetical protein